jgi:acyl-CoA dehydrogenase
VKLREKLAGRFADALSWWVLAVASLRRFAADGGREEDLPPALWAADHGLAEIQAALEGIARNFEAPLLPLVGRLVRGPGALWLRLNPLAAPPPDRAGRAVAAAIGRPGAQRDRLTGGIFVPADPGEALGRLERALDLVAASRPIVERIAAAARDGRLGPAEGAAGGAGAPQGRPEERADEAVAAGVIDRGEAGLLAAAAAARRAAIEVDSFSLAEYLGLDRAGGGGDRAGGRAGAGDSRRPEPVAIGR